MDPIITILSVVTKDLPIFPQFTPYNFLSRCKFSTLTTRQPMVEFYLLTFPRFPLRKKEHKSYFGKNRTHDFRTRCAGYLLDHSGDECIKESIAARSEALFCGSFRVPFLYSRESNTTADRRSLPLQKRMKLQVCKKLGLDGLEAHIFFPVLCREHCAYALRFGKTMVLLYRRCHCCVRERVQLARPLLNKLFRPGTQEQEYQY